ncbi:MAG TPA: hypothetical protein VK846_09210, partial [Candidatus Limnocylindria bacterium]|nr:hypothetical protein [Candidatus Limnocylindria bacterium]
MKMLRNQLNGNAKTKFTLALCTVLALTAIPARADDYNDKDKNKGAPDKDSVTATGRATSLSRSDQKFIHDAARGGMM